MIGKDTDYIVSTADSASAAQAPRSKSTILGGERVREQRSLVVPFCPSAPVYVDQLMDRQTLTSVGLPKQNSLGLGRIIR